MPIDSTTGKLVEGILIRPDGSTYLLEALLKDTRTLRSTVTKHPVEDGSQISDHIVLDNKMYTMDVIISDATFDSEVDRVKISGIKTKNFIDKAIGPVGPIQTLKKLVNIKDPAPVVTTGDPRDVVSKARQDLEEMRDNRERLTLRTSLNSSFGDFSNLVITGITSTRNKDVSIRNFQFTLDLEQIQITDRAASITFVETAKDISDDASSKAEKGKQSTSKEDEEERTSVLQNLKQLVQ